MPNVTLRGYQVFGANDEILNQAVDEVKAAVKAAKASGEVQVVSLFRRGYRHDLQIGELYVVPPSVCDSAEDFPLALLRAQVRHHATPEGRIEFEMGALVDKDDLPKETLTAFKDVVFREGGEGDLKPLLVWRACWSSPYDAIGFLYDEKTVLGKLREVAYAAPFNPALSSVLDALKATSENHAAFVVSAPVTQHMFSVPDSEDQDFPKLVPGLEYPAAEEDGRTKKTASQKVERRPVLRITAANIPAVEKDILTDGEMQCMAAMDQEVGDTVVASEESGLRESPLSGLITASSEDDDQKTQVNVTIPAEAFGGPAAGEAGAAAEAVGGIGGAAEAIAPLALLASLIVAAEDKAAPSQKGDVVDVAADIGDVVGTRAPIQGPVGTATAVSSSEKRADGMSKIIGQLLAIPSGEKRVFKLRGPGYEVSFVVYFDAEEARGDMGGRVPGMISGEYEVWATTNPEDQGTYREVTRQHVSPGKPGGMQQSYAAEQCVKAMAAWVRSPGRTASIKHAGFGAETVRAVRRFTENFAGHYMPLKALREELSRLTGDVKGALALLNQEGLVIPFGSGVKVLNQDLKSDAAMNQRRASFVIKNASGQHWACVDVEGVKMAGYWTDAEAEAHNFIDEKEAHEEVRRCCLGRDGAVVMPKGIAPLKLATWWSPGRILAAHYPELVQAPSHVPGKRSSFKHHKQADSWFQPGRVYEQFGDSSRGDVPAPLFPGEISQEQGNVINPWGAPGNGAPQAPAGLAGTPEGLNQMYDGAPLKQEMNFYGPEFMREFYAPQGPTDLGAGAIKAAKVAGQVMGNVSEAVDTAYEWHSGQRSPLYSFASLGGVLYKESGRGMLENEIEHCMDVVRQDPTHYDPDSLERLENLLQVAQTIPAKINDEEGEGVQASAKTAAPFNPTQDPQDQPAQPSSKTPSFLDALNMAAPEADPKVPYIDPQQDGNGIDNPSPAYLMMDKLLKGCMGAYTSQLLSAFNYTGRPLELEVPFTDKIDLADVLTVGSGLPAAAQAAKAQLTRALDVLTDDEKKQLLTDSFSQAAVWCDNQNGSGGFTYEVFARAEALEGSTLTVKAVTGIR